MIKKIWITGASSGIGEALAKKFAEEKWQVAASARRENLLQNLNKHNPNIHPFPLDVTDSNKTIQVFENIIKKLENIDICVFCAGVHDPQSEKKLNVESIRRIIEVNFFGTLNCINAVNYYFKEKQGGHISVVSSVAAYRGLPAASGSRRWVGSPRASSAGTSGSPCTRWSSSWARRRGGATRIPVGGSCRYRSPGWRCPPTTTNCSCFRTRDRPATSPLPARSSGWTSSGSCPFRSWRSAGSQW